MMMIYFIVMFISTSYYVIITLPPDFRFPSRPKRSQSEVDDYRFHCLNSTLPKLIRSYRQFEAGIRRQYPEKLLSKLDLVIRHYQEDIKAYSVGGPTCRLSSAGRLVAAAVQEIVCSLCCSFAYCDLLLCKLCSWRAHSKCTVRLGITSCPRCPIESKLKRIDRVSTFFSQIYVLPASRVEHVYRRLGGFAESKFPFTDSLRLK